GWRFAPSARSACGLFVAGFESETRRTSFGLDLRRGKQRVDHAFCESRARANHVAYGPARVVTTIEGAGRLALSGDKARVWTTESQRFVAGEASFLQRLLESDRTVRLARAAHDRFRSPGGPDSVLHFARRVCRLVA